MCSVLGVLTEKMRQCICSSCVTLCWAAHKEIKEELAVGALVNRSRDARRLMEGHGTEMLCLFSGALLELQVKVETLGSVDPEFLEW